MSTVLSFNAPVGTDGYKTDHRRQYPDGLERVDANFTPRSTKYASFKAPFYEDEIVHFGLQAYIKQFLIRDFGIFFELPKEVAVSRYKRIIDAYLGKDKVPMGHIEALHDLGYLPLRIQAIPEGECVKVRTPLSIFWNTHPDFGWLPNFLETIYSTYNWGPCTSATTAREYRKLLEYYCHITGGDQNFVDFQAHDFSFRGMFGPEAAMMSGGAHLTAFKGTDTIPALPWLEEFYNADVEKELVGCSVPATEHSVMCAGGIESERDTFKRLLELYPEGVVSVVSDTWDYWKVLRETLPSLKDDILARNGTLVIRPDSGNPIDIIAGTGIRVPDYFEFTPLEIYDSVLFKGLTHFCHLDQWYEAYQLEAEPYKTRYRKCDYHPQMDGSLQLLWDTFGGHQTHTCFRVLDSHIGLIYGDSITHERCADILERMRYKGFCSTCVVFGIGLT